MTTPMPETKTYILQNQNGTSGSMHPIGYSVYLQIPQGVSTLVFSWSGSYDVDVYYTPTRSTSDAWIVGSFVGQVESQTESLEIPTDMSTGYFYVRSKNVSSGNANKPLGLIVTSWPI